jgi:hypothetical protein
MSKPTWLRREEELRGTGRTQRMLEAAVASEAEIVVIVVRTRAFIGEVRPRVCKMIEGCRVNIGNSEIHRPDGRRVMFHAADELAAHPQLLMGLRGVERFVDHDAR